MKTKIGLAIAALAIAASAGGLALAAQVDNDADDGKGIGIPNPASVFCEEQGGTVEIVNDAEGNQSGVCRLPDGTRIDEWEYWRRHQGNAAGAPAIGEVPETGGNTPLAPRGVSESDVPDPVLFIEGEPVTAFDGDSVGVLNPDVPSTIEPTP